MQKSPFRRRDFVSRFPAAQHRSTKDVLGVFAATGALKAEKVTGLPGGDKDGIWVFASNYELKVKEQPVIYDNEQPVYCKHGIRAEYCGLCRE